MINLRAHKIVLAHLAQVEQLNKPLDPPKDLELKKTILDTLRRQYTGLIESHLRSEDVLSLFLSCSYMVKHFSDTETPTEEFNTQISFLKPRLLKIVKDIALLNKNSLADYILSYVKENPGLAIDDIEAYSLKLIDKLKRDTKIYLTKNQRIF